MSRDAREASLFPTLPFAHTTCRGSLRREILRIVRQLFAKDLAFKNVRLLEVGGWRHVFAGDHENKDARAVDQSGEIQHENHQQDYRQR